MTDIAEVEDYETLDDFAIFKMGIFRKIAKGIKESNIVNFALQHNDLLSKSQIIVSLDEVERELHEFGIRPQIDETNVNRWDIAITQTWTFTNDDKKTIDDLWYSHPHKFGMIKATDIPHSPDFIEP